MKIIWFEHFDSVVQLLMYVIGNKIKKKDIQQILQIDGRYMLIFWKKPNKKLIDKKEF